MRFDPLRRMANVTVARTCLASPSYRAAPWMPGAVRSLLARFACQRFQISTSRRSTARGCATHSRWSRRPGWTRRLSVIFPLTDRGIALPAAIRAAAWACRHAGDRAAWTMDDAQRSPGRHRRAAFGLPDHRVPWPGHPVSGSPDLRVRARGDARRRMTDTLTPAQRSERMARVRDRNTKPEMRVRRALHAAGLRYRLHDKRLPGKPDLVLSSRRVVVFIHGCFWHRHPDPDCKLARLPKSRPDFWVPKLEGNAERDRRKIIELEAAGWTPFIVWECKTTMATGVAALVDQIRAMPSFAARVRDMPGSGQP